MRNALVLLAVAGVALVAVWDAARDEPPGLAELGAAGRLVFADPDCRRVLVELPSGRLDRSQRTRGCSVFSQAGSLGIERGEVAWFAFRGGTTTLLTLERLRGLFGPGARALRAAWLGDLRYVAIVARPPARRPALVLFERDRVLGELARLRPGFDDLRSSPGGGFLAASDPDGGLAVFDREGRRVPLPAEGRAVAWSPDERLAAVALPDSIAVLPAGGGAGTRLPHQAVDVDWRA